MSKDPAVLWYFNDWHGGTCTLSRFLKGCYMDLLHAQFNNGNLSIEEIKTVLGSDFGSSWPTLQKKFKQDDKGLFFNERLATESIKRKSYTKSRKDNLIDNLEMFSHMESHMEDENENKINNVFRKWIIYKKERKEKYKTADSLKMAFEKLVKISDNKASKAEEIINDAIANNYSGFFKLKKENVPQQKGSKVLQIIKISEDAKRAIAEKYSNK